MGFYGRMNKVRNKANTIKKVRSSKLSIGEHQQYFDSYARSDIGVREVRPLILDVMELPVGLQSLILSCSKILRAYLVWEKVSPLVVEMI